VEINNNNDTENDIRPSAVGKNCLFIGSPEAGTRGAVDSGYYSEEAVIKVENGGEGPTVPASTLETAVLVTARR